MNREHLRGYLTFYRDLGVEEIYRREKPPDMKIKAEIIPLAPADDTLEKIRLDIGD